MANTISNLSSGAGSIAANGPTPVDATRQNIAQSSAAKAATRTVETQQTDHANVSTLGGLVSKASAISDVRLDKVSALQQQISAGTYNIPAKAVASKIVDSLLSSRIG